VLRRNRRQDDDERRGRSRDLHPGAAGERDHRAADDGGMEPMLRRDSGRDGERHRQRHRDHADDEAGEEVGAQRRERLALGERLAQGDAE
jgi:hypothetical protein